VPTKNAGEHVIIAGCQYHTLAGYRAHTADYIDDRKRAETLLILDFLAAQSKLEPWSK
jgi:hypothetical protein